MSKSCLLKKRQLCKESLTYNGKREMQDTPSEVNSQVMYPVGGANWAVLHVNQQSTQLQTTYKTLGAVSELIQQPTHLVLCQIDIKLCK